MVKFVIRTEVDFYVSFIFFLRSCLGIVGPTWQFATSDTGSTSSFHVYLRYIILTFGLIWLNSVWQQLARPGDWGPMFPAQSRVQTIRSPSWQVGFRLVNCAGKPGQAGAGWCSTTTPPHWRGELFGLYRPGSGGHEWNTGGSRVFWKDIRGRLRVSKNLVFKRYNDSRQLIIW